MRLLYILLLLCLLPAHSRADSTTVFNELYYHPADAADSEWVELANVMSVDMDLSGWRLDGGIRYVFPEGTIIEAGGYLVVAADPGSVKNPPLFGGILGPFEGRLANEGEEIELRNVANRLMSFVDYGDREPWPVAADGAGASLAKRRADIDSAQVESWTASLEAGGTPGRRNFREDAPPNQTLRIHETAPAGEAANFWMELSATSEGAQDLEGYVVAIADDPERQAVLTGLAIGENGYQVIDGNQLGFGAADGDLLCLYSPDRRQVVDAVLVDDVLRGRSVAHPDRWLFPASGSPGEANDIPLQEAIVINEIMYRAYPLPATKGEPAQFESVTLGDPEATDWRAWDAGNLSGDEWRLPEFDDSAWLEGGPVFAGGNVALPAGSGTPVSLSMGKTTYYFRLTFVLDALPSDDQLLRLRHLIDDGAAFYLNGEELARVNLPEGELTGGKLASTVVGDPFWSDALEFPAQALRQGLNVLAVEVHQSSFLDADTAFAAELTLSRQLAPAQPAAPFRDAPEEWVELYNRSEAMVDLSGWSLDEGIRFAFPQGTQMAPGAYLVVASDRAALAEKYPDRADRLLGDFDGMLSNSGENLLLRDARGNPADEVRYYDGGRWPSHADGGGATLELRDPDADNSKGEAWAASDESAKTVWQEIVYRMVCGQNFGLNTWNELNLGMLSAGEVLIDDVEVIEDPDGARRNLIQNSVFAGTLFDPDGITRKWRFVGNHRHSHAVPDPDDEGNSVLRVIASGATDTKHNHLETTFRDNQRLNDGEEYEVRLRARWVAGSNQLNMRAYYARLARTVELEVPENLGTPGAVNSRREANIGPTFDRLRHDPLLPEAGETIAISVQAADPDGIETMTLHYAEDGEAFAGVPMVENDGLYVASVPGMPAGTVVQFYVEGSDGLGHTATFPAAGPDSRALFIVDDGRGTDLPVEEMRLIMLDADFDFLFDRLNLISDERIGCTVLLDNGEAVYGTGVRLKGSPAGRARDGASYQGFNIAFPPEQRYRGIHSSVSLDRSGRSPQAGGQDEIYVKHLFNRAGLPAMFDDLVYIVSPTNTHTGTALLSMARFGGVFTESQFEDGDLGTVFNLEITYDPTQTENGSPEGMKLPVPFTHMGTDFRDLGDDKEQYRWPLELRTGRRADDYEGLMRFCQTMDLPADQLAERIVEIMDVDLWMRSAAMHNLCAIGDTWWNGGLQHNIRLYVPWHGKGVVGLPWDLDFVFTSATSPLKTAGGNLRRVMDIPANTRLYYGHLLDLIDSVFTPEYMEPWLAHYGSVVGQNFTSQAGFIRSRASSVRGRLEEAAPPVAFEITSGVGGPLTVEATATTLRGRGWINVREVRLAGYEEAAPVKWVDEETWEVVVPLLAGENVIELQAYGFSGELLETDTVTVTSTAAEATPLENLRISEVHYHPAEPSGGERDISTDRDDYEFLELQNIGDRELDLGGIAFSDGIDYTFNTGTVLPGGAFVLLVRDAAAFAARYGSGLPVAGEYGPTSLNNGGERIEVRDRHGYPFLSFAYQDSWIPETDGMGFSLTIADVGAERSAWSAADAWLPSASVHGSPGRAEDGLPASTYEAWAMERLATRPDVSGPNFDADSDGIPNLVEYAFALDPLWADPSGWQPTVSIDDGEVTVHYRQLRHAGDLAYEVQFSNDLKVWTAPQLEILQESIIDDRVMRVSARELESASAMRYVRVLVKKESNE